MAMTYQDEKKKEQVQPQYNLQGVSAGTQAQLARGQQGYQPSETVQQAQANLQQVQGMKPQSYNSKYGPALESILQQIQNPEGFKYEFNGDNQFKYLADLFTNQGRQASLDAQGQAAALTGGYGNSYGALAGAQAYQQHLLGLYDRGIDLQGQAYQRYADRRGDLYNQMGALQGADETEYGRNRDAMADWRQDVANAQNAYQDERDFGYTQYTDALDNATRMAQMENADYRATEDAAYRDKAFDQSVNEFVAGNQLEWAQLEEKQRQFDANLSEEQRQYNQNQAISLCSDILARGQMPSNDLLVAAGLSYEDAQKLVAQVGGGTPKQPTATEKAVIDGVTNAMYGATGFTNIGAIGGDYAALAQAASDKAAKATGEDKKQYNAQANRYQEMLRIAEEQKKKSTSLNK